MKWFPIPLCLFPFSTKAQKRFQAVCPSFSAALSQYFVDNSILIYGCPIYLPDMLRICPALLIVRDISGTYAGHMRDIYGTSHPLADIMMDVVDTKSGIPVANASVVSQAVSQSQHRLLGMVGEDRYDAPSRLSSA